MKLSASLPGKLLQRKRSFFYRAFWWLIGFGSAIVTFFIATLWMAGVVYSELPQKAPLSEIKEPYDVIICLTGGRGRIRNAFDLFESGVGKKLYISGIDPQVQLKEILNELKRIGPVDETNIVLEKSARNTIENAIEVKNYLDTHQYKKALLVTSIYHVRRANYIFKKKLSNEINLDVTWNEQGPFGEKEWWKDWNGIWVTVSEFFKFFYAYIKLNFLA